MTKPIPPRYGKKGFRAPVRAPAGIPPRRGQVERAGSFKRVGIGRLGITFMPDGSVHIPRFREKQGNPSEIEKDRMIVLADPYSAVRYAHHQFKSIGKEAHALKTILDGVRGAHLMVEKNWKNMSRVEQKKIIEYFTACVGAFGDVERLRATYKVSAAKRLERAVELLEEGTTSASQTTVMGVTGDLIARINQSIRQRKGIQRRHLELVDETAIRKDKLDEYISAGDGWLKALDHPRVSRGEIGRITRQMKKVQSSMAKKIEPELKAARAQLAHAERALARRDIRSALADIRAANRESLKGMQRQYLLPLPLVERVARTQDAVFRRAAFSNQLNIMASNIQYWGERSRDPKKIVRHLNMFARAIEPDFSAREVQAVRDAAKFISGGQVSMAAEALGSAVRKKN